ncbi:MAG: septum formation initiator family protein [Amphiplicatus sp.]
MRQFGKFLRDIAAPVLFACWIVYLGYGAVAGASGYRVLADLRAQAAIERDALEEVRARRLILAQRAALLNPRSLDPDMIDERIRAVLGYADPDDIVLPRKEFERVLEEAAAGS